MTRNVTLAIDAELLKKARKIAVDKDTTVTGLIRNYLETLIEKEGKSKKETISELVKLLDHSNARVGKKTWSREDLHER
jgi:hypothetical protein